MKKQNLYSLRTSVRDIITLNTPERMISMRIRDRGKIKFLPAHFMPEHRSLLRELARDELRQARPLLDEYEIEELENRICSAMEYTYPVKITKWVDGFTYEERGHVHYLDPIRKEVRLVAEDGSAMAIKFEDIVAVEVEEVR
jgi:hypothetical protein